jgi:hypothetical protein
VTWITKASLTAVHTQLRELDPAAGAVRLTWLKSFDPFVDQAGPETAYRLRVHDRDDHDRIVIFNSSI